MKLITLSRALLFIALFLFVAACTKETDLPGSYAKSVVLPKEPPAINYGAIKGYVNPVPQVATMKVYDNEGYSAESKLNSDGSFFVENIPEGIYRISFSYLIVRAEYSYYASHDLERIVVTGGAVNNIGEVQLPWTY